MMQLLALADYVHAAKLFRPMPNHLAVAALLAGAVPGQIYVDDAGQPRAAVAWLGYRVYVAGDPGAAAEEVRRLVAEVVFPAARARGNFGGNLHYTPEAWAPVLEAALLPGMECAASPCEFYEYDARAQGAPPDPRAALPPEFSLCSVDAGLLARPLAGRDALREEMCSERPSVEEFLAKSFGVCLVRGDELAGWCLSEYNLGDRCEVGIETREPYRRRGLGTAMALALVEAALARGITRVGWHCQARNAASGATARKAGFAFEETCPTYIAWFKS